MRAACRTNSSESVTASMQVARAKPTGAMFFALPLLSEYQNLEVVPLQHKHSVGVSGFVGCYISFISEQCCASVLMTGKTCDQ